MQFDYKKAEVLAKSLGLVLDAPALQKFDNAAAFVGMSQDQVDEMLSIHIWHVLKIYDPKTYPRKFRLLLALRFFVGIFQ